MKESLYCPSCRRLHEAETDQCEFCLGELRKAGPEDMVFLTSVDAESFGFLQENLKKEKIDFKAEEQSLPPDGSVYSGKGLLAGRDVYVAFRDEEKARSVLEQTFETIQEMEKMPQGKRIAVQVLSVLGFIVLIYLVVYGADAIVNLIKSLL